MQTLNFIYSRGAVLPLYYNERFLLKKIDNQTAFSAAVASSVIGGVDGDTATNVQANARDMVLYLLVRSGEDVEDVKRYVLSVVKPKQTGSLVWTQNGRTVTISGIVDDFQMQRYEEGVVIQFSMHCGQPFWEDIADVIQSISDAINLHSFTDDANDMLYFPANGIPLGEYNTTRTRTFTNEGDVAVGMLITIEALSTVTNPLISNGDGEFFGIGYGTGAKQLVMQPGDNIVISTVKGKKSVKLDGVNILDKLKPNSTWLQLAAGDNVISINSDDVSTSNMIFDITYKRRFV